MSRDDGWSWRGLDDFESHAAIIKTKPLIDCFNRRGTQPNKKQ
jgi:hypothetical protein